MPDYQLSKHFRYSEFFVLGKCGEVSHETVDKAIWLCDNILEPARERIGLPIKINSGKRSAMYNQSIGGAKRSEHVYLLDEAAADIDTGSGAWNEQLFRAILDLSRDKLGQLIAYIDVAGVVRFIHVSKRAERWASVSEPRRFLVARYESPRSYGPFEGQFKRP